MTLLTTKNEIKTFATTKLKFMRDYVALIDDLNQKLKNNQMYQSEVDLRLKDFKNQGDTFSKNTAETLMQRLDNEYNAAIKELSAKEESVTADDVAELSLLSSMSVTKEEMLGYMNKYINKPLALKKLQEIAQNDLGLSFSLNFLQYDHKNQLQTLIENLKKQVQNIDNRYLINGDKIDLVQAEWTLVTVKIMLKIYTWNTLKNSEP